MNIPTGRLITQVQLIKRLLAQAKIADLLEVNLDRASLARQLALIQNLSQTIPVKFDVGKLPALGTGIESLRVPVTFDIGKIPQLGPAASLAEKVTVSAPGLAELGLKAGIASDQLAIMNGSLMRSAAGAALFARSAGELNAKLAIMSGSAMRAAAATTGLANMGQDLARLDTALKTTAGIYTALAEADRVLAAGSGVMTGALSREAASFRLTETANKELNTAMVAAIPLWRGAGGWFGLLTGKVQLFGGVLTAAGVPAVLATASGFHILIDAAIELAAVIVPATIALAAFGAGAAPTINDIQKKMQAVFVTSVALNQAIYPMSNSFKQFEAAVKPSVLQLFGEALVVVTQNTGLFQKIAVQTGQALDQLGARAAVALTSGGMAAFLKQGPHDLAMIGDIIGNIFGTIGNFLRVIPGYAQVLLGALDAVTRGIEAFTGSDIGQWALKVFLAFHGFILWAGLAATAAVFLGNGMVSLAAKFGLAEAGALAFNAAAFGAGIKQMLAGIGLLIGELIGLGTAEDIAAAGAVTMEGAFAAVAAVNPLVWAGLAAAAIGFLVFALTRVTSATNSYNTAVKNALGQAPVSQLSVDIVNRMADTTGLLRAAQDQLNRTQEYGATVGGVSVVSGRHLTDAYRAQLAVVHGYQGELATLQGYQANFNALVKAAGGNLSFLAAAGITSNDVIGASTQQMKQYIIEVQAAADAQRALGLGIGRSAAAQNAQTNTFMTETLPAMQKVTQAEDNLMNVILGGEQAFIGQQQAVSQMAADFKNAGGYVGGLGAASLTMSSDFYTSVIPAIQKTIDALQQQGISTGDLTKAIATSAGQLLGWAGKNDAARAVIVALINNALGPGTVSLQTLNKWVNSNSTSLQGFNSIVAKSTIAAGIFANVLQQDLNAQFAVALLKSSGATADISRLTDAIVHGGTQTEAYRSARAQLIQDLINTGMNAHDAAAFVDGLQQKIDAMHGKTVNVAVTASGSGGMTFTEKVAASISSGGFSLRSLAGGGIINMGSGPTADDVLVRVSRGETVVSAADSRKLAGVFAAAGVPGYSFGGLVGKIPLMTPFVSDAEARFARDVEADLLRQEFAHLQATVKAAAAAKAAAAQSALGFALIPGGGSVSGSAAAAQAWARGQLAAGIYGWGLGQWPPLLSLWNQESGWRWNALNPSSGAYGIPQSLPASKMASAGSDWQTNPVTQMRWGLAYIRSVYGAPSGAWAHEVANNWYAAGGVPLPGYATGGSIGAQGAAFLKAWQHRRGGGFGAAWGPVPVNPQIDAMQAALYRATVLSHAGGLSAGQHRFWAAAAADEKRRLSALIHERDTERAWRSQLAASDASLAADIAAAGSLPSLRRNVAGWKMQIAGQKSLIGMISMMLGLSAAQVAAAEKAGTLGPGGAALPAITHTYGAVTDVIEAFLQAHAAPFTGKARGGLVMSYDRGGWMPPGLSMSWNGTGRPEPVGGAREIQVTIGFDPSFQQATGLTPLQLANIRKTVKVVGGGSAQRTFGSRLRVSSCLRRRHS